VSARGLLTMLLALTALLGCGVARADTTCTTSTPVTAAFGNVANAATAPTVTTTSFTITCNTAALSLLATASVRACLGVGIGTTGVAISPLRRMTNASGDPMSYQLFTSAAYSTIWGLTPGTTPGPLVVDLNYSVPLITGGSGAVTVTLYGRIPASQTLAAGNYSTSFSGGDVRLEYAFNEVLLGTATAPAACTTAAGVTGHKTATGGFPFTVTATVLPQCSTYVTTDMDFGTNAGAITANIDRTSTLGLTCLNRTAYTIALDNGLYPNGTVRRMRHTTNASYFIPYELYQESTRTQRWGSTANVDLVSGTGTGSAQTLTVYGRAPPTSGAVAEGSYSDQIKVTITY
jgi:spore coat protein U-like protein